MTRRHSYERQRNRTDGEADALPTGLLPSGGFFKYTVARQTAGRQRSILSQRLSSIGEGRCAPFPDLSILSSHSTPCVENDAFAAGLVRKATNLLAASGEGAALIGAAT
jgi:hypothetical protein